MNRSSTDVTPLEVILQETDDLRIYLHEDEVCHVRYQFSWIGLFRLLAFNRSLHISVYRMGRAPDGKNLRSYVAASATINPRTGSES